MRLLSIHTSLHVSTIVSSSWIELDRDHYRIWFLSLAFGVSKRDYLIARRITRREDGSIVIAQKSIVDDGLYTEQSGYIRGDLLCSGYVIKPVKKPNETTATSCHVTYVIQTDVKGK